MLSIFFLFKQKTAYEMRISDWSSDVCSSDLFVDGFLSDDARLAYEGSQLSAQLGALGVALPGTREGFADIVQGIDRTTESGEALYEALLALAGQADSYYQDVEDAVTQEQQAAQQTQQDAAQAAAEATAQWRNLAKSLYDRSEEHTSELQSL